MAFRRKRDIHSVEDVPFFGRLVRIGVPGPPSLRPGETTLFDFPAGRASLRPNWSQILFFVIGRHRSAMGRLTVTNERMIFSTYRRDYQGLFIFKVPASLGAVDLSLAEILQWNYRSWWQRAAWGASAIPGGTMVEIETKSGDRYRFFNIPRKQWDSAMGKFGISASPRT